MSAYISLAQLKSAVSLPNTDTQDDAALQSIIFRASATVDEYLKSIRPGYVGFAVGSNTRASVGSNTRRYDGSGTDTIFIDDAQSISTVVVDGDTVDSTAYEVWPYNEAPKRAIIYIRPVSSLHGLRPTSWSPGTANVSVTGFFGLAFVPDDVAVVVLRLAQLLWRRETRVSSETPALMTNQRFSAGAGRQIQSVVDMEISAILSALDSSWYVPAAWGA